MGFMTIKIDLEKAYDSFSWRFICDTLKNVGFPLNWATNVMHYVETPKMSVIWNGKMLD